MIPLQMVKDNKYYVFIQQCNNDLYLYDVYDLKRKNVYYKETFKKFDLGEVEEVISGSRKIKLKSKW